MKTPKVWTQTAAVDAHRAANLPPKQPSVKLGKKPKGPPWGPRGPYKLRKSKIPPKETPKTNLPINSPALSIGSINGHPIYGPVASVLPSPVIHNFTEESSVTLVNEVVSVPPVIDLGLQSPASTIVYSDGNLTEIDDDIIELDLDDDHVDIVNDFEPQSMLKIPKKSEILRSIGEKIG